MKKFRTIGALAAVICCLAASACGGGATAHAGEYSYQTEYGVYGVKVNVYVKGETIDHVEIVESDYTQVTESWEGKQNYLDREQALLDSFKGKTVSAVKGYSVVTDEEGAPSSVSAEGLSVVTGATMSTGRLLLAVQNALSEL